MNSIEQAKLWESLSEEQKSLFCMGNNIEKIDWYFSDLQNAVNPSLYDEFTVNKNIERIKKGQSGDSYGITDIWLYEVLERNPIKDQTVAIMGSINPWYESVCIFYGGKPVTIEYNIILPTDSRLKMIHINDYKSYPKFDAAFSISSFEHDGLGRYGDPIDPNGDFRAMREMKEIIKPNGLLFLAVPIGKDKIVWNAHRKYGKFRLPYLLDGWEIVDQSGFDENLMDRDTGVSGVYQPVFVLKNI